MQPYQKAGREIQRQADAPGNALKKAALAAPVLATGGGALSRILPMLSEYIPSNLAANGLKKIDSRFGKFIDGAIGSGQTLDEVMGFIKKQLGSEEKAESPKKQKMGNAVRLYSDELMDFLESEVGKGRDPLEAGMVARQQPKYKKVIEKMEREHKSSFDSILQSIFGMPQQKNQGQALQGQQMDMFQGQVQQQTQQGSQQGGQGQQALMAILQKIQQSRGG